MPRSKRNLSRGKTVQSECRYCDKEFEYSYVAGPIRRFCDAHCRMRFYEERRDHYGTKLIAEGIAKEVDAAIKQAVDDRLRDLFGYDPRRRKKSIGVRLDRGGHIIDLTPTDREQLLAELAQIEATLRDSTRKFSERSISQVHQALREQLTPLIDRLHKLLDPSDTA